MSILDFPGFNFIKLDTCDFCGQAYPEKEMGLHIPDFSAWTGSSWVKTIVCEGCLDLSLRDLRKLWARRIRSEQK